MPTRSILFSRFPRSTRVSRKLFLTALLIPPPPGTPGSRNLRHKVFEISTQTSWQTAHTLLGSWKLLGPGRENHKSQIDVRRGAGVGGGGVVGAQGL